MKQVIFLLLVISVFVLPQKRVPSGVFPAEKSALLEWKFFDGNRINATINSAGPFADYLRTNNSGLEWPKGSKKYSVFTSGLWVIGRHQPSESLRTAVMYYLTEYQPGPILSTFNTTTNDNAVAGNPSDKKYRIYKINRGDTEQSNIDYAEWPGDLGAPYLDLNNNGVWDVGIDKPKITGNQTLWSVFNDAHISKHNGAGNTPPIGLEVRAEYFGYDHAGQLGDVAFIKYTIINRSDATYDSVYASLWSDIDMGDANDDYVATDSALGLFYVYNGDNDDAGASGYGSTPPATGFMFLQGLQTPGSINDSIVLDGKMVKGLKHLGATSSMGLLKNSTIFDDPGFPVPSFARMAHNIQRGLTKHGDPFTNLVTGATTKFSFTGDPITESGWTMQRHGMTPLDVRGVISTGPVTIAPGERQEIIGAYIIARGKDRLHSIAELRALASTVRNVYASNFSVPVSEATTAIEDESAATVTITAAEGDVKGNSTKIYLYGGDNLPLEKHFLADDGTNGDTVAGDGIYTVKLSLPTSNNPYYYDLTTYTPNYSRRWNKITSFRQPGFSVTNPVIHSENIKQDGKVNPGETVRFGVSIKNPHSTASPAITVTADVNTASKTLNVAPVSPASTASVNYQPNDPSTYISFFVPADYSGDHYVVRLTITDALNYRWTDSVVFPVSRIQSSPTVVERTKGNAAGRFTVMITDPSKVKNQQYVLYGIDSVTRPTLSTFGLKYGSGAVIAERISPVFGYSQSPALPEYDGFKIVAEGITTTPKAVPTYLDGGNDLWFTVDPYIDTVGGSSTFHFTELPDIRMKFSTKTGYTDANNNNTFDLGEQYFFDSLNTDRSQRAYFYRQATLLASSWQYIGFLPVPFTVYEVNGASVRQLAVVINDRNRNGQWELSGGSIGANSVYIMKDTYDPTGVLYDSTKGGISLINHLRYNRDIPYYYNVNFSTAATGQFLSDAGELFLKHSRPFTSKDEFTFNPTVLMNVRNSETVPDNFSLEQNYPNPFNPSTTIAYSLPHRTTVAITVSNLLGQTISTIVNGEFDAGNYTAVWNGKDRMDRPVASGIYFYTLRAGNFHSTKKMMLMK